MNRSINLAGLMGLSVLFVACTDSQVLPPTDPGPATLLTVSPQGGTTNFSTDKTVTVTFDHPMATGMEGYAALHEGDVKGPEVSGMWSFSTDRMTMTFTPAQPLKSGTTYSIHIGGGMTDDHGNTMDMEQHGFQMGGQWASGSMMGGGMGGGMNGGTDGQHEHMGEGWQHENGTYGMVFTFTTA